MSGGHGESQTPVALIFIIGLFLIGALVGIFYPSISTKKTTAPAKQNNGYIQGQTVNPNEGRETDAYYIKADIDKPVCGIKIFSPLPGQQVNFPLEVSGYVNGCDWTPFEGQAATVIIRDNTAAISREIILPIEKDNLTLPAYFKVKITPDSMPSTNEGVLIFYNIKKTGEKLETFQVPIIF